MIEDPAEALDILLEELRRQKAAGVRRVSISAESVAALRAIGFEGYAIGGLAVGEDADEQTNREPDTATEVCVHARHPMPTRAN